MPFSEYIYGEGYSPELGATSFGVPARFGTKVAKFTVNVSAAPGYAVGPLGPNDDVHRRAFAIDPETRTVSARISVAGVNNQAWVVPTAVFCSVSGDGSLVPIETRLDTSTLVRISDFDRWYDIFTQMPAPEGATHWKFQIRVFGTGAAFNAEVPPDIGTELILDGAYVTTFGSNLDGELYLDGSQEGAHWLDQPDNSISAWGASESGPDADIDEDTIDPEANPDAGQDGDGEDDDDSGQDDTHTPSPAPVVPPEDLIPQIEIPKSKYAEWNVTRRPRQSGTFCVTDDIQLGPLLLNSLDSDGTFWAVTDADGWWTLPEPDIPDYPRGYDDGSYETSGRWNARVFTLTGSFFPTNPGLVAKSRGRLIEAANLCRVGNWFATHEADHTLASKVWLSGQPMIQTVNMAGRTDFSIGLKAPDPIKYGLKDRILPGWNTATSIAKDLAAQGGREYNRTYPWSYQTASGSEYSMDIFAMNSGNTNVYPVIELRGDVGGRARIVNASTGQYMDVVRHVRESETLVIDCMNKSVTLDGAPNQRWYMSVVLDWLYLQPGVNRIYYIGLDSAGTSTMTLKWRSGWIG